MWWVPASTLLSADGFVDERVRVSPAQLRSTVILSAALVLFVSLKMNHCFLLLLKLRV